MQDAEKNTAGALMLVSARQWEALSGRAWEGALPNGHVLLLVDAEDGRFVRVTHEWQEFGGALCDDGGFRTEVRSFLATVDTPHGPLTLEGKTGRAITHELDTALFRDAVRLRSDRIALYAGPEAAARCMLGEGEDDDR